MTRHSILRFVARMLAVTMILTSLQGALRPGSAQATTITTLTDWNGVTTYLGDPSGDTNGGQVEDLIRVWVTSDASYLYVRWDTLLGGNKSGITSTLYGLALNSTGSATADAMAWVYFDQSGVMSEAVENSAKSVKVSPSTVSGNAGYGMSAQQYQTGTTNSVVTVTAKYPLTALKQALPGFDPTKLQPLWAETHASQQWTSNVKDRVPDAGYMNYNVTSGAWTAVGTGPILTLSAAVTPSSQYPNKNVTYSVSVTNIGDGAGTIPSLGFALPSGFTYVSGSASGITTTAPSNSAGTLTWSNLNASVPALGTITESFRAVAAGTAGTTYYGTAYMNGTIVSTGDTAPVTILTGTPPVASASTSTVSATPSSVVADGVSATTVTVRLKDASSANLTTGGDTVTVASTMGTVSGVTDNGDGTYTATVTSPVVGTATVSAKVNGSLISSTASVAFTAGTASTSKSTVTANPTTVVADGTSVTTVTVQLKDASDRNLTTGGDDVVILSSLGNVSAVTDHHDGTYTATVTSSVIGTATLSAKVNGSLISSTASVVFTAGAASTSKSTVTANPTTVVADGTSVTTVTVQLKDAYDRNLTTGGDDVVILSSLGNVSAVSDNHDGTYTATVTSTTTGMATISAKLGTSDLTATAKVDFVAGGASLAKSVVTASPASVPADGANASTITVQLKDAQGNNLTASGGSVTISTDLGTVSAVTDNGNGTYTAQLTAPSTTGTATVSAKLGTSDLTATAKVDFVAGGASLAKSVVTASPASVPADGTSASTITVQLKDGQGNNLTASGGSVTISTDLGTVSAVSDNGDGTYTATVTSATTGTATISAKLGTSDLTATAKVNFVAGGASLSKSVVTASPASVPADGTSASTITVQLKDAQANNLTASGGAVTVSSNLGTVSAVTDKGDGTYTATVTSTTTGMATISAKLGTSDLTATAKVDFVAGGASLAKSVVTASPASVPADGTSASTITVQLKDAHGNNLTASGGTVTVSSNLGTVSAVTDNGNGTYTAQLTAPSTTGTATVSAKLNAQDLSASATVAFTAVPGSIHGTVTEASTGNPVAGTAVTLTLPNATVAAQATTAQDGTYTLSSVPNTSYTLTFSAAGYVTRSQAITVQANQSVTADAALFAQRGTVSGRITNAQTNLPIVGATVTLTQSGSDRSATTDADGHYAFTGVSSILAFTVSAAGTGLVTQTSGTLSIAPGGSMTQDLALQPVGNLLITAPADGASLATPPVVSGSHNLPGTTVTIYLNGVKVGTAVVQPDNTWQFDLSTVLTAILPGTNTVSASAPDSQNHAISTMPVRFNFTGLSTVSGTVRSDTGGTVSGAQVEIRDLAGHVVATTTTDSNGHYTLPNLKAGTYEVVVPGPDENSPLARDQVVVLPGSSVTQDLRLVGKARLVLTASPAAIVGDGAQKATLEAQLNLTADGTPVSGVTVAYSTTAGTLSSPNALTGPDGKATVMLTAPLLNGLLPKREQVQVTVSDPAKGIYAETTLVITFLPASITGVIVDDNTGTKVAGAEVSVSEDFDGDGFVDFTASAITGADGTYSIVVPRGNWTYHTVVKAPVQVGSRTVMLTSTHESQVGQLTGLGETIAASAKIKGQLLIQADETAAPATADQALKNGETIQGTILSQSGAPINQSLSLGVDGSYEINGIAPGTYQMLFQIMTADNKPLAGTTVSVTVNQSGELSLQTPLIDPYGIVRDATTKTPLSGVTMTLYWADTPLNRGAGRVPGTVVQLPGLDNFPPNKNRNSQTTTSQGEYAWMVFAQADYYIQASAPGYKLYDSTVEGRNVGTTLDDSYIQAGVIHVGQTIMHYDLTLQPLPPAPPAPPTPPTPTPATPGLTATPQAGAVVLTVTAPAGSQSFHIKRSLTPGGPFVDLAVISSPTYTDTAVQPGVTYYYEVTVVNNGVEGPASSVASAQPPLPVPTPPVTVTATPGDGTVQITWPPVPGATSYEVVRSTSPGGAGTVVATGLTQTQYTETGLTNGTTYYYAVIAVNGTGVGAESTRISATPQATPKPATPPETPPVAPKPQGMHQKYINGYPDGTFQPDRFISRAEVAAILVRLLELDPLAVAPASYPDVSSTHWASHSIDLATALGLMKGYPDGNFRPNAYITRAEIAVVAVRFAKLDVQPGSAFTDTKGHWAESMINTVFADGVVQGYPGGAFEPQRPMSRAEFVTVMNRLLYRGPLLGRQALWPDVPEAAWSFGQVQEASIGHAYEQEPDATEKWLKDR